MKKTYSIFFFFFSCLICVAQNSISDARAMAFGTTVSISGVITLGEGDFSAPIIYMQDADAGIAVYDADLIDNYDLNRGDSVSITGVLEDYNDLLEVIDVTSCTKLGTTDVPHPLIIAPGDMSESYESMLVTIEHCETDSAGVFDDGNNYMFKDIMSAEFQVRLQNGCSLDGDSIAAKYDKVTGVLGQYNGTYQIMPRDSMDLMEGSLNMSIRDNSIEEINIIQNTDAKTIRLENISNSNYTINLFDLSGKVVLKDILMANEISSIAVDRLNRGLYLISFNNELKALTRKIVVN